MKRTHQGPQLWFFPLPLVVVGAEIGGRPTFTTIAWSTPVEDDPPLVLCAIAKDHYLVSSPSMGVFSLNFPSADQVALADYCGIVSGYEEDKSAVVSVEYGLYGAPLVGDFPLSLECRVRQWIDIGESCWLLVGEVVESYIREDCLVNGKPDVSRMNLISYITKQSEYRLLGERVARAREVGMKFRKELP